MSVVGPRDMGCQLGAQFSVPRPCGASGPLRPGQGLGTQIWNMAWTVSVLGVPQTRRDGCAVSGRNTPSHAFSQDEAGFHSKVLKLSGTWGSWELCPEAFGQQRSTGQEIVTVPRED